MKSSPREGTWAPITCSWASHITGSGRSTRPTPTSDWLLAGDDRVVTLRVADTLEELGESAWADSMRNDLIRLSPTARLGPIQTPSHSSCRSKYPAAGQASPG